MKNFLCNIFISADNQSLFNSTERYINQYKIIERNILFYIDNEEYLKKLYEKIINLHIIHTSILGWLKQYNFNIEKINDNLVKISLMESVIIYNQNRIFEDLKKYDKPTIMRKYNEGEILSDDK